jgi:hypothetical protein
MNRAQSFSSLNTKASGGTIGLPHRALQAWRPAVLADELQLFEPLGLREMAGVALLDRIDTKYVLSLPQLLDALPALRAHYRVLEVEGGRQTPYWTLYFDTPSFALYHHHQAGRRVRYKVRSRKYLGTDQSYFEVKQRTGPGHTHKERLPTRDLVTQLTPDACAFLHGRLPLPAVALEPKLWVTYTRVTLVSRRDRERLTLDFDLRFSADGASTELAGLVTAEVKHAGRPRASVFIQLMRLHQIRPNGFSKYCIGASLLNPDLKHNRFNRALRLIGQRQQGEAS